MASGDSLDETDLARENRIHSGYCCWHCRYYIRPAEGMIDGPAHSVCTLDRARDAYWVHGEMAHGDKGRNPEDCCGQFEADRPPGFGLHLRLAKG